MIAEPDLGYICLKCGDKEQPAQMIIFTHNECLTNQSVNDESEIHPTLLEVTPAVQKQEALRRICYCY